MSVPATSPSPAAQAIITTDKVMDFLPGASTLSNGVILITKVALELLNLICHSAYESIKDYSLVKHVEDKHGFVCIMLSIPFLNTLVAYFYHTEGLKQASDDESPSPLQSSVLHQNNSFFTAPRSAPAPQNNGFNNSFSNLWQWPDDTQQYQNSKQQFDDDMKAFGDDLQKFGDDLLDPIAQARTQQQLKLAKASYKQYLSNLPQQQQISQQRHQQIIDQAIRTQSDIDAGNNKIQAVSNIFIRNKKQQLQNLLDKIAAATDSVERKKWERAYETLKAREEKIAKDSLDLDDQAQDQSDCLDAQAISDQSIPTVSISPPNSHGHDDMQQAPHSANASLQQVVDNEKQKMTAIRQSAQATSQKYEQEVLDRIAAATDSGERKHWEDIYETIKAANSSVENDFDLIAQAQIQVAGIQAAN